MVTCFYQPAFLCLSLFKSHRAQLLFGLYFSPFFLYFHFTREKKKKESAKTQKLGNHPKEESDFRLPTLDLIQWMRNTLSHFCSFLCGPPVKFHSNLIALWIAVLLMFILFDIQVRQEGTSLLGNTFFCDKQFECWKKGEQ